MTDDELRARLRAADPAASLPPGDPTRVARLMEDVMSTELTTENRQTGTRHRSRLTWAVAAAAVVVIAGAGFIGVRALTGDDAPPPGTVQADPSVLNLAVAETAGTGKCLVPNVETLSQAQVAFDGTVTQVEDGNVVLEATTWYAGQPADHVVVTQPSEQLQDVASAVRFEEGGRYLVSAIDDRVTLCGFSAEYDEQLAALYEQAFG